ncbi:unnamed protein product [Closterium sp. NIES-65]|nr:unnamed protein product [Closterium sp. NIES-65]
MPSLPQPLPFRSLFRLSSKPRHSPFRHSPNTFRLSPNIFRLSPSVSRHLPLWAFPCRHRGLLVISPVEGGALKVHMPGDSPMGDDVVCLAALLMKLPPSNCSYLLVPLLSRPFTPYVLLSPVHHPCSLPALSILPTLPYRLCSSSSCPARSASSPCGYLRAIGNAGAVACHIAT